MHYSFSRLAFGFLALGVITLPVQTFKIEPPTQATVGIPATATWTLQAGDPASISIGPYNVELPFGVSTINSQAIDTSQKTGTISVSITKPGTFQLVASSNGNAISESPTFKVVVSASQKIVSSGGVTEITPALTSGPSSTTKPELSSSAIRTSSIIIKSSPEASSIIPSTGSSESSSSTSS
ncbi:hypothetical protein VKT23_010137 [Stygiomarasmius scandens]|uniref:Uncharacterized protein n=1 Tax=Marasmiellus scandens TaxID=2682957 RepID=A0ABR1JEN3_9AGAR